MVILDLQIILILIQFNSVPSENNANNCGRQPKAYISAYGKQPNVITLYLPLGRVDACPTGQDISPVSL